MPDHIQGVGNRCEIGGKQGKERWPYTTTLPIQRGRLVYHQLLSCRMTVAGFPPRVEFQGLTIMKPLRLRSTEYASGILKYTTTLS